MNGDDDLQKVGGRWVLSAAAVSDSEGHNVEYQIALALEQLRGRAREENGEILWSTLDLRVQEGDPNFVSRGDLDVRVKAVIKTWRAS